LVNCHEAEAKLQSMRGVMAFHNLKDERAWKLAGDRLLPLREKVAEGRMRGTLFGQGFPYPALRATFSRKGRREGRRSLRPFLP
jgi:hypothetical protein